MNKIYLSIVIPAYNEADNLKNGVLDQVYQYLKQQKYSYEVLIVDDGSKDETVKIARDWIKDKKGFEVIKNPHGGKALTVMAGLLKSRGEIVVFTDLDQATPLNQIEHFFPKFKEGFDVAIGSRQGRKGAPLIRKLSAWGFAFLRNLILGLPFKDTQCGFKAFTHQTIQEIFPKMLERWQAKKSQTAAVNAGFDVETLFLAKREGLKIAEVPVEWHHVGTERVQLVKDALEAIKDIIRIRINSFQQNYD